jgi:hypothetical protein
MSGVLQHAIENHGIDVNREQLCVLSVDLRTIREADRVQRLVAKPNTHCFVVFLDTNSVHIFTATTRLLTSVP